MESDTLKQLSLKVSQYFLEFLESDFKRQQAPRRRIVLQTETGLKSGMSLSPYQSLQAAIWQQLAKPWESTSISVTPKTYQRPLSHGLKAIVREQVSALTDESRQTVIDSVIDRAKRTLNSSVSHPEEWITTVREELADALGSNIVRPMLALLDAAIKDQAYSAVDSVYTAEADLILTLAEPLDAALTEVLARYSTSRQSTELETIANDLLSLEYVRSTLQHFFESFSAADAYLEFRDLETYVTTADNIQLYLYVGTIQYSSTTYPLFYIPLDILRSENGHTYTLTPSNHIYANKRAVDFILQELGERAKRQWLSPIKDRITYIPAERSATETIEPLLTDILRSLDFTDDLRIPARQVQKLSHFNVSVTNQLYFCAFDKSDEALLNDYEEMISQIHKDEAGVVNLFQSLISGVITSNPESIAPTIDKLWDETSISSRLVVDTPIPLNEEQQKVLKAIQHEDGKIIVVEGPPGTGKSHTIVAIAADCAFRKKSCLILSDKKEALEVVHDKLSSAMNAVRNADQFPNPLLRLGTEQANFRKLTSASSLAQVATQAKAAKNNLERLQKERDSRRDELQNLIQTSAQVLGSVSVSEICETEKLKGALETEFGIEFVSALEAHFRNGAPEIPILSVSDQESLGNFLRKLFANKLLSNPKEFLDSLEAIAFSECCASRFSKSSGEFCPVISEAQVSELSKLLSRVEQERHFLFGWLFKKKILLTLASECQQVATFSRNIRFPDDLLAVSSVLNNARIVISALAKTDARKPSFEATYFALANLPIPIIGISTLLEFSRHCEHTAPLAHLISQSNSNSKIDQAPRWISVLRYVHLFQKLIRQFSATPELHYVGRKAEIERLNTVLMNTEVDSRLVNFMENSRTDAKVLSQLIKEKQKFPETKFESVKNAFPVMIASIREFGEYMPLKSELLDVLVIDEASQVSVAQAFPALLRAKKVVVMGDSNQFSNTKSSNASNSLNQKFRGELETFFKREVSNQADMLERLSYFDVKRSVLEFCQLCANFSIMLRKHFRSYKELINYSSTQFYGGNLQAIKLRTIPVSDCISFSEVPQSDTVSPRNTNLDEVEYILEQCESLLLEASPPTVGIITPFREQHTTLTRKFSSHPKFEEFRTQLKLKIMTFDSCQGEERQIIFYSMVATRESDNLNYVFPVALENASEAVTEKLKLQRLNVGFSRAQEMVWFVVSKPIDEFRGSIGAALRHFRKMLEVKVASAADTDPLSPMESKVLEWIYATAFYQNRVGQVEVIPQFPIGDYLRQLDPTYKHPHWRVDFLVAVDVDDEVKYIVIEYDGFEYHFKTDAQVTSSNFEQYMNESDIERQLTLESYGYRFLRLNRFNLGLDPVLTLSDRLLSMLDQMSGNRPSPSISQINTQAQGLRDKSAKQCSNCKEIKMTSEFFDPSLGGGSGGYGRICLQCKNIDKAKSSPNSGSGVQRHRRWK